MYAQTKLRAVLPANGWEPRQDQIPLWAYLERGGLRADIVAHRRWGKDDVALHWTATAAHRRVGTYWHMLPEATQARKAIWDAINPATGKRRIDEAFPKFLRASTREQDMFIKFKCGSSWQVVGSDNFDSLVGSPPIGVIFSEWALAKPNSWQYIRPILRQNKGWALFIWTPRGRNHATRAFEARAEDPTWYTQRIPAAKVESSGGKITACTPITPVFTAAELMQELREYIDETGSQEEGTAIFNTEYLVDFDAPVPGSYYGSAIQDAVTSGRITRVPHTKGLLVDTSWDLGMHDYTSIWFWQRITRTRINAIGFYETNGLGLDGVIDEAFKPRDWAWGMHYLPHDVAVRELGAGGRSRRETLYTLGLKKIRTGIPRDPEDRINASRRLLPNVWFDKEECAIGLEHLKQYRKKWNESLHVYTGPLKNDHDHSADAFGEFAVNAKMPELKKDEKATKPKDSYTGSRLLANLGVPHWKVQ